MSTKSSKFNLFISHNDKYCVANTMTCSVVCLEKSEYSALKEDNFSSFSDEHITALKKEGILVEENLDEIALLRHTYFYGKSNDQEAHLTICPTLNCNFACPYCYEKRVRGQMSKSTQDNVIKFVENLLMHNVKRVYVVWYGGEPLLYPTIIENISANIRSKCAEYSAECIFSMISNGYLLNENNINMLNKIELSRIQITLDGLRETHNKRRCLTNGAPTFDKIVKNILNASKSINITVRVNVDRSNSKALDGIKHLFDGQKNVEVYCAPVTVEETQTDTVKKLCFSHEEYDEFYKENITTDDISFKGGINCCAAETKNSFVIDPNGYIYKCLNDLGLAEWSFGNINSYEQKYNILATAKYLGRDPFSEPECIDCVYLPLCYGGCVWSYKDKGTHACKSVKYLLVDKIKKEYLYERG